MQCANHDMYYLGVTFEFSEQKIPRVFSLLRLQTFSRALLDSVFDIQRQTDWFKKILGDDFQLFKK